MSVNSRLFGWLALVATLLAIPACSSGQGLAPQSAPQTAAATTQAPSYKLGPGDKLRMIVFGEPDLSGEFVVDSSGGVNLPLIGSVPAAGASVPEFKNRVTTRFRNGYLKDPKISVEVLNYRPFFIVGEVKNGGEYPYKAGLTVQDAVAIAGGYTYRADTSSAYIRRAGKDQEVEVDLDKGRVKVNPGDNIRVPERFF
ncbi:polysaccharide export protein [Kaustia mangrovi]|uniref:Polysaccharide export protein n=1 Tax=Kaustia mangrovi TaxID=2593653 RepID=A0A7S8C5B7_9HYPH|nr:polysaccharide biosynthesis/export family protein [Kaustia mangrovi]QPC43691.1 polysaccharide export protein [Kaustia mangrovi]